MSFEERLHAAQRARDLRGREYRTDHIDLLAASAIASKSNRIGAAAFRTLEDERFAAELFVLASKAVIGKARSRHWKLRKREQLEALTVAVGRYWLKPYCPHCDGRGVLVEGQIAKNICHHCGGTGKRALPTADEAGLSGLVDGERFERYVRETLACLDGQITGYLGKTRAVLG
jgi:rRNA maturation protein Nop10